MNFAVKTRFPKPVILGVLFIVVVLSACEAFYCGDFEAIRPIFTLLEIRCSDDADSRTTSTETTLSRDVLTLIAFYNATDGPNWEKNTNWLTDAPISEWAGVTASNKTADGRPVDECVVRDLSLSNNQLKGEIPAEIGNLADLRWLNLRGNQLSGTIPPELDNLANMRHLDLSNNHLKGQIPAELGNLPNLEDLDLGGNELSGTIPPGLGNLANLEGLSLWRNQLSGEIPPELGNLLRLESLNLKDNQLSGEIPAELGNLPNLRFLDLSNNQLNGEILIELGKIPTPILDGNALSGRIVRPNGTNPQYAWNGSSIIVSWDAVDGADYYKIYYDAFFDSSCSLRSDGSPHFCEELADNVVGTSYVHTDLDSEENYYWVVSCNSDGCSDIDSKFPAAPIEPISAGPTNVTYAFEVSAIRVTWEAVPGADYYKVYHDAFFDSSCSLRSDGSPHFCEELAANVVGTSYLHENPDASKNYYWVVTCNRGGCSDIDSKNQATAE